MRSTRGAVRTGVTFLFLMGSGVTAPAAQSARATRDTLAHLILESKPAGRIAIDDSIVGETPKTVFIPAGTHTIRISREGYLAWEQKIAIEAGETLRVTDIVLALKPRQEH